MLAQIQGLMLLECKSNKCSWLEHLLANEFALSCKNGLLATIADARGIDRKHQSDNGKTVNKWIADHWIGLDTGALPRVNTLHHARRICNAC